MTSPSFGSAPLFVFVCLNDRGGAEISMLRLAQGLLEAGRNVTCIVYGTQPALAPEFGFKGKIIDLECRRTWMAFAKMALFLRKQGACVLLSALTHTNVVASYANLLTGNKARVFVIEHGIDGMTTCQKTFLFRALVHKAYRHVAGVVAVSKGLAEFIIDALRDKTLHVETIYNPITSDKPHDKSLPAHVWLEQKDHAVLLGIGRLTAEKNFELLIRAFARLLKTTKARLVLLGEGPERSKLENLVRDLRLEDVIILPGFISNLNAWLPFADLLVLSSNREGFGNVIVEALAQGICVVATDCPYGPKEILENGLYGQLVPMNDTGALTSAIEASLKSSPDKVALQKRAAQFGIQRCIDDYLALIDNQTIS